MHKTLFLFVQNIFCGSSLELKQGAYATRDNNDYTVNFYNTKFSDGATKFNNINKYIDSKQIEINIRDSYRIYTIQNGGKNISYDESKEDNYPMTMIQGRMLVPITELKKA